jgi:hypothetical protein
MNPVRAGLTNNAYYYPWSSISAHFRSEYYPFMAQPTVIPLKNKRQLYHTRLPIPADIKLLPSGHFDPVSIISPEHVERIMKTSKSLSYFVGRSRDSSANTSETKFLCNDTTALAKARELAQFYYGSDLHLETLSFDAKKKIAQVLKYNYGTPSTVINRILALGKDSRSDRG